MPDKVTYWLSIFFSGLALLLLITNTSLISGNRSLQEEVNHRQVSINTAVNLSPLNQNLVQALAGVAQSKEDTQVRDLLSSQGIKIRKNADKAGDDDAAAAKKKH